eukprot:8366077-Alexandrium_andersonii.AAC.1
MPMPAPPTLPPPPPQKRKASADEAEAVEAASTEEEPAGGEPAAVAIAVPAEPGAVSDDAAEAAPAERQDRTTALVA